MTERIEENAAVFDFELSHPTMAALDALDERFSAHGATKRFSQLDPY
jgi:diketogulonate reductase-like aldo/keto reductase